jgi:hypothetical protein
MMDEQRTRVTIDFFRDVALSNQAFLGQIASDPDQPTRVYSFASDESGPSETLRGRWIVHVDERTKEFRAVSEGNRDDWQSVTSTDDGFVAEYDNELVHLDGHEVTAVFDYLDAKRLFRTSGILPDSQKQGTTTIELTEPVQIQTVARALALVGGGTRLRLSVNLPEGLVTRVDRYLDDQLCESALITVERSAGNI